MRIHPLFILLFFCVAPLAGGGCAPKVPVQGTRPAVVGLPGVETLYVMRFKGDFGFDSKICLLQEFRTSDRFVIRDQEIDERPTSGWAGVRGMVNSNVEDVRGTEKVTYDEVRTREITYTDTLGRPYLDENGLPVKVIEEIREARTETVQSVTRSINLDATVVVEDVSRGFTDKGVARRGGSMKFGGAQAHPKSSVYNANAPKLSDLGTADRTLDTYACEVGRELAQRLLPVSYTMNITLSEEGGELVEMGVDMAERENWPAAVVHWERALTLTPNNAGALYNLGVAAEYDGGLEGLQKAKGYYQRAMALGGEDLYATGMSRIAKRMVEEQALQRQLGD